MLQLWSKERFVIQSFISRICSVIENWLGSRIKLFSESCNDIWNLGSNNEQNVPWTDITHADLNYQGDKRLKK